MPSVFSIFLHSNYSVSAFVSFFLPIFTKIFYVLDEIMHLAHELVKSGIRISSSHIEKSKYFNDVIFLLDLDCPDAENTLKMVRICREGH